MRQGDEHRADRQQPAQRLRAAASAGNAAARSTSWLAAVCREVSNGLRVWVFIAVPGPEGTKTILRNAAAPAIHGRQPLRVTAVMPPAAAAKPRV